MNTFHADIVYAEKPTLELANGESIQYRTSWTNLVIASRICLDDEMTDADKMYGIAALITGRGHNEELSRMIAEAYLERFFPKNEKQKNRVMDFDQDAALIYSAFRQAYGINLHDADGLSAGEFLMLLAGLPESTRMSRVVEIRSMEVPKGDKERASKVAKAKRAVALKTDDRDKAESFANFARTVQDMTKGHGR